MVRLFCLVCHGPLPGSATADMNSASLLARYLSAEDIQQAFKATQDRPKTLLGRGGSIEVCVELDKLLLKAGIFSQIFRIAEGGALELFVEQRVQDRRYGVIGKMSESNSSNSRKMTGRRKSDKSLLGGDNGE